MTVGPTSTDESLYFVTPTTDHQGKIMGWMMVMVSGRWKKEKTW
jgi:hypothetical protein